MPKAFVSHIEEEAPLALVIKKWAESSFLRLFEVFVSSVPGDITAGHQWFQRLEAELNSSKVVLVICSPASVHRLWVNFEAGAGWIKGIPVIPICHSGMTKAALPMPLVFFQALDAEGEDFAIELMSSLATHFGHETPPISQEMVDEIKDTLSLMRQHKETMTEGENKGIFDILVSIEDNTSELGEVLSAIGNFSNVLTAEILMLGQEIERIAPGANRQMQRLARGFGSKMNGQAGRLTELNEQYGSALPKLEQDLEDLMSYSWDTENNEREPLQGLYTTLDETENSIEGLKEAVVGAREALNSTPNMQRDLTRGMSNISNQLGILVGHLDRTLEAFRRGKAKLEVLGFHS